MRGLKAEGRAFHPATHDPSGRSLSLDADGPQANHTRKRHVPGVVDGHQGKGRSTLDSVSQKESIASEGSQDNDQQQPK